MSMNEDEYGVPVVVATGNASAAVNTAGVLGERTGALTEVIEDWGAGEAVNHPAHYGGEDNPYEAIKVIEAWGLDRDFCLGNTLKYIARHEHEDPAKRIEDLEKARWYLDRRIQRLKAGA